MFSLIFPPGFAANASALGAMAIFHASVPFFLFVVLLALQNQSAFGERTCYSANFFRKVPITEKGCALEQMVFFFCLQPPAVRLVRSDVPNAATCKRP